MGMAMLLQFATGPLLCQKQAIRTSIAFYFVWFCHLLI